MSQRLDGLSGIHIELTNRCNKNCWMCGCRQMERENPDIAFIPGDMEFSLLETIAAQLPPYVVTQLHNNGEPLLYPRFKDAVQLFQANRNIVNIVTNGKLLLEKADDIVDVLDTMSISIFEKDDEAEKQFEVIEKFFAIKNDRKPFTSLRLIGNVDANRYRKFNAMIIRRVLRSPMGTFDFRVLKPTIPEIGICMDFLTHPAINIHGDLSVCVNLDPHGLGILGNIRHISLRDMWYGEKRMQWLQSHMEGRRNDVPLCATCDYWGVPTGYEPEQAD